MEPSPSEPRQRFNRSGRVAPALSASRAKEYERCPLQYRLHVVDALREPPTRATAAGTLVHSVLEHLFDAPASERTAEHAHALIAPFWASMKERDPQMPALFPSLHEEDQWLADVRTLVGAYFDVEDPRYLEPMGREEHVEVLTSKGVRLRGFIDRIDRSPTGMIRVVDYKTGRAPSPRFQEEALFQMRFYALLLRLTGREVTRTQLLYLRSGQVLTLDPSARDVRLFEDEVHRIWDRIEADARRGYFPARRNPLCNWCGVRQFCQIYDGTTPDIPEGGLERLLATRVTKED